MRDLKLILFGLILLTFSNIPEIGNKLFYEHL
jgi:hypothetical protein